MKYFKKYWWVLLPVVFLAYKKKMSQSKTGGELTGQELFDKGLSPEDENLFYYY